MPSGKDVALSPEDYERAANKLRDLVTTIEFTMISVIAGLMLFPWIEYASPLIRELRVEYWVYLAAILVAVMFYWAALTNHALTFVGWPIDIIHNLLYLLLFPGVGIIVHFVADPTAFYPMWIAGLVLASVLTGYDLHLIDERRKEARGAEADLLAAARRRQVALLRYVLALFGLLVIFTGLLFAFPDFFIQQHMHVALGVVILSAMTYLLIRECRELAGMRDRILRRTAEAIARERQGESKITEPVAVINPAD